MLYLYVSKAYRGDEDFVAFYFRSGEECQWFNDTVQPSLCTRKFPNNFFYLFIYKNSIKEDEASIEEKKKGRYFLPFSLIRMVYYPSLHDSLLGGVVLLSFFVRNFFFWRFFLWQDFNQVTLWFLFRLIIGCIICLTVANEIIPSGKEKKIQFLTFI